MLYAFIGSPIAHKPKISASRKLLQFNGAGNYAKFPFPVDMAAAYKVRFKFSNETAKTSAEILLSDTAGAESLLITPANTIQVQGTTYGSSTIDGVAVVYGTTQFPTDGENHLFEVAVIDAAQLAYAFAFAGVFPCEIKAWDFEIEDNLGVITKHPMSSGSIYSDLPSTGLVTGELLPDQLATEDTTVIGSISDFSWTTLDWKVQGGKLIQLNSDTGVRSDFITIISKEYAYNYEISGNAPASISLGGVALPTAVGVHSGSVTAIDAEGLLCVGSAVNGTVFESVEIDGIKNYLAYKNVTAGDWGDYRYNSATNTYEPI